jgi:hypothetical protein
MASRRTRRRLGRSDSKSSTAAETICTDSLEPLSPPISITVGEAGEAPGTIKASIGFPLALKPATARSAAVTEKASVVKTQTRMMMLPVLKNTLPSKGIIPQEP